MKQYDITEINLDIVNSFAGRYTSEQINTLCRIALGDVFLGNEGYIITTSDFLDQSKIDNLEKYSVFVKLHISKDDKHKSKVMNQLSSMIAECIREESFELADKLYETMKNI